MNLKAPPLSPRLPTSADFVHAERPFRSSFLSKTFSFLRIFMLLKALFFFFFNFFSNAVLSKRLKGTRFLSYLISSNLHKFIRIHPNTFYMIQIVIFYHICFMCMRMCIHLYIHLVGIYIFFLNLRVSCRCGNTSSLRISVHKAHSGNLTLTQYYFLICSP